MKRRFWLLAALLAAFTLKLQAQTDLKELPTGMESAVKNAEAEFREFICELALNFDTRAQSMAIQIAADKEIIDERFNGTVFSVLRNSTREGQFSASAVEVALKLMPLCTLDTDTKLRLLLDSYVAALKANSGARRTIIAQMKQHPNEVHRMVVERLQEEDFELGLLDFELLDSNQDNIHELLPIFLATAKSDNEVRAAKGTVMASELIKRLKLRVSLTKSAQKLRAEGVSEESIAAASALYKRYDRNGDGRISQREYGSRSRTQVIGEDLDDDGFVTFRETVLTMKTGASKQR